MKRILLLLSLAFVLSSCNKEKEEATFMIAYENYTYNASGGGLSIGENTMSHIGTLTGIEHSFTIKGKNESDVNNKAKTEFNSRLSGFQAGFDNAVRLDAGDGSATATVSFYLYNINSETKVEESTATYTSSYPNQ
ncbi:MAG: lipoprotein [Bacteroidales bacterium]|jgi:hypothetical protein|nr:lipoprotein [Bacteroidales bacterium]